MKFKKGDRVRCVSDVDAEHVRFGRLYTIGAQQTDAFVTLADLSESHVWLLSSRFVLAVPSTVAPKNRSRVDAGPSWGLR